MHNLEIKGIFETMFTPMLLTCFLDSSSCWHGALAALSLINQRSANTSRVGGRNVAALENSSGYTEYSQLEIETSCPSLR